jgi:RNA polymerase sigma-70 factor (ECF subfamily)
MSEPVPPIAPKYIHEEPDMPRLLLQRIAAGDKEAFHAFYRHYGPRVAAVVRKRVTEPQLAEELVQDIFVAAWQSAQGYRSDLGDPELWLFGIARHKLQDHRRRLGRIAETLGIPSAGTRPDTPVLPPEVRLSIAQALGRLSVDQRRAIDLIYTAGLTFREASRMLGIPIGTVKSRVNAALGKMKAFLSDSKQS